MEKIPIESAEFDRASYVDPNARVFRIGNDILRAVLPGKEEFYEGILDETWFRKLQEDGLLINTERSSLSLEGYPLTLKHRRIETLSYCPEWPARMLKKAAILTVDLCLQLLQHDMSLQDAHPWNIQFEATKPVFIDVGSICPLDERSLWEPYQQFCNFFLFPLYLYNAGIHKPTRAMLFDYLEGISQETCSQILPMFSRLKSPGVITRLDLPALVVKMMRTFDAEEKMSDFVEKGGTTGIDKGTIRLNFFEGLKKEIESIWLPGIATSWSQYVHGDPFSDKIENWNDKQKAVMEILEMLKPASVLDLACNKGWYSILAAKMGAKVISVDSDEECISSLFREAEYRELDVLPLVMNILNPTPAFGWQSRQFLPATNRLKAEMTFALAIVHHLVFSQWQSFERVVGLLDGFTEKWLLVEFVPDSDEKVMILKKRKKENYEWYNLENFVKAINEKFADLRIFNSYPEGRKLLLCRKALA